MSLKEAVNNPYSPWMDDAAPETDVVISSRIRLARSLANFPYPHRLSAEKAGEVVHMVALALREAEFGACFGKVELVRLAELAPMERLMLVEKHLISPDFLTASHVDYQHKGLVLAADEHLSIMVNEEDHLRIQSLYPGLQLGITVQAADEADNLLEKTLDFAFSDRIGYLTACPTNVGTGLRASVMLHLPALVLLERVKDILTAVSRLGLTVRGLFGEGTGSVGHLFQLSNQVTLGHSEVDITNNLDSITRQVIDQERTARDQLQQQAPVVLRDRVSRAFGILRYAHTLSSEETMRLISDVRLGVGMGLIKGPTLRLLSELMVQARSTYLMKVNGRQLSLPEQGELRATLVRQALSEFKVQSSEFRVLDPSSQALNSEPGIQNSENEEA